MAKPLPEVRGSAVLGWDQESASPVSPADAPGPGSPLGDHQQSGKQSPEQGQEDPAVPASTLSPGFYARELLSHSRAWVLYLLRQEILTDAF